MNRLKRVRKMEEKQPFWKNLLKYFLHGLSFSVILTLLIIIWALVLVALILIGSIIGLIIGFIILLFIMGGLNSLLASLIWSISIKTKWTSLLGHGLVLSIALVLVGIPAIIINLIAPSLATSIALIIIYAFIDGFVAKLVAMWWKEEYEKEDTEIPPEMIDRDF